MPGLIYIPLWFYSNKDVNNYLLVGAEFTFHYGSILIPLSIFFTLSRAAFTFHYGSILINTFSLNTVVKYKFTFHYGSILMV